MDEQRLKELLLIEEVKKEGREFLYNDGHPDYKNKFLQQIAWTEISSVMGMSHIDCYRLWKILRLKYVHLMISPKHSDASSSHIDNQWLVQELNFLKDYLKVEIENSSKLQQLILRQSPDMFRDIEDQVFLQNMNACTVSTTVFQETSSRQEDTRRENSKAWVMEKVLTNTVENNKLLHEIIEKVKKPSSILTAYAESVNHIFNSWPFEEQLMMIHRISTAINERQRFLQTHNLF